MKNTQISYEIWLKLCRDRMQRYDLKRRVPLSWCHRRVRESQQELSRRSSSYQCRYQPECVCSFCPASLLASGRRENPVQTIGTGKRTKLLAAQVEGQAHKKRGPITCHISERTHSHNQDIWADLLQCLTCSVFTALMHNSPGRPLTPHPCHLLCSCSLRWKPGFEGSGIQEAPSVETRLERRRFHFYTRKTCQKCLQIFMRKDFHFLMNIVQQRSERRRGEQALKSPSSPAGCLFSHASSLQLWFGNNRRHSGSIFSFKFFFCREL